MRKIISTFIFISMVVICLISCDKVDDDNQIQVYKTYECIEADTSKVKTEYELGESISTYGLIVYGIDSKLNKYKLRSDEYQIKIYVDSNTVDEYNFVAIYRLDIEYIGGIECKNKITSYNIKFVEAITNNPSEPVVPDTPTQPEEPSEPVVPDTPTQPEEPSEPETIEIEVAPKITVLTADSLDVEIPNLLDEVTSVDIKVTTDSNNTSITKLKDILTNIDSTKTYTFKGRYTGKIDDINYIVNVKETSVTTAVVETLSKISVDKIDIKSHANLVELPVDSFKENVPDNYMLKCFEVTDEDGNYITTVPYDDDMETIYVDELENNSKYLISPCYSIEATTFSLRRSVTYTYDFKFVGIWVMTYGDDACRIRMRYQGTTLYTYYVTPGIYRHNSYFYNFVLPNELSEYKIVGTVEDLSKIYNDVDTEVILHKIGNNPMVYFFGFNGNVESYESVTLGSSATAPAMSDVILDENNTYIFDGWEVDFSNVLFDLFIEPKYIHQEKYKEPNLPLNKLYIGTDSLVIKRGHFPLKQKPITLIREYLEDEYGYKIVEYTGGPWSKYIDNLNPNTYYKYTIEINYDLEDGKGVQQKVQECEFTTLSSNYLINDNVKIERNEYPNSITISSINAEFDTIAYLENNILYDFDSRGENEVDFITAVDFTHYEIGDVLKFKLIKTIYDSDDYKNDVEIYHVYDNEYEYTVTEKIMPQITDVKFDIGTNIFTITGNNLYFNNEYRDNTAEVVYEYLERDEFNLFSQSLDVVSISNTELKLRFSRPDVENPETGQIEYYAIRISFIEFYWSYYGHCYRRNSIKNHFSITLN